ncbi:hypothetical protein BC937DRAFT_88896 [Endogone sp. FLAS-F59071]|nr:hypothetical protein BC937DRAFT_88896 [Endogone sp. FLAS-F59071]|eukprot:RUS23429.1 hypothetical protein BC937DRAFT_88896 [Endogone sp. FLAS-F59071]
MDHIYNNNEYDKGFGVFKSSFPQKNHYKAFKKHGHDSFKLIIIILPEATKGSVLTLEQHLIDTLYPEYNLSPTASSTAGAILGPQSAEHRAKLSAAAIFQKVVHLFLFMTPCLLSYYVLDLVDMKLPVIVTVMKLQFGDILNRGKLLDAFFSELLLWNSFYKIVFFVLNPYHQYGDPPGIRDLNLHVVILEDYAGT